MLSENLYKMISIFKNIQNINYHPQKYSQNFVGGCIPQKQKYLTILKFFPHLIKYQQRLDIVHCDATWQRIDDLKIDSLPYKFVLIIATIKSIFRFDLIIQLEYSYYKFVMNRIHKNGNHTNQSSHINEDQVLNSFYQQRKKRMNNVSRHHSLLQKNSSYFSTSYNKHISQSNNFTLNTEVTKGVPASESGGVVFCTNIDKKIANIKQKIMRDISNESDTNVIKKYSLDEGNTRIRDDQRYKQKQIRIQSQSTTPTNKNMNKINLNINIDSQNINNMMFNGWKKQNKRQKHLDQLQKRFMDLTSPTNFNKDNSRNNNNVIDKKLQKYANQNKDSWKQSQGKISQMKQNIYIVNKMKDYEPSINSQATEGDRNRMGKQKSNNKQQHQKYAQNSQNESSEQQQVQLSKYNDKCMKLQINEAKKQQQFESPSFKMSKQLKLQERIKKKLREQKDVKISNNCVIDENKKKYDDIINEDEDELINAYVDENRQQKNNNNEYYYQKLIQQNQMLKNKISSLQKIRKKQSKFIQSVYRMRRTILKTNQDCNLKQLWRWLKVLPNHQ